MPRKCSPTLPAPGRKGRLPNVALSPREYDLLERAAMLGSRLAVTRRGSQRIVVALRFTVINGRERLEARHPSTGETVVYYVDELDRVDVVR